MTKEEKQIGETVTVRELIIKLLDCPMDWEVVVRSKGGYEQKGSKISVKEPEGLGCLFG